MAEMPDVVTLTTVSVDWGNDIRDRTIQRYSSVANRTSEHSSPTEGDLSYLEDANTLDVYNGSAWVPFLATNEVDGSVETITSGTATLLTTSLVAYATVNLTIPAGWGSWKCEAYSTCRIFAASQSVQIRIRIDGTDQMAQQITNDIVGSAAVGGRRTAMTTTGSRAISLMAIVGTAGSADIARVYLYARAVRTS